MDNFAQQMNNGFIQMGQNLAQTNTNFSRLVKQMEEKQYQKG